ncbi:MAG: calcium/sodium antiporter [Bdellovibrionales bacterium]|nr:calcium/sodium antiporter [Bdellovibrionales bacterium]
MDLLLPAGSVILGFGLLLFGGDWLVLSAVSLACRFRISPSVIGLTIVAAGTSVPEMITSLMATHRGSPDIAIGNVVGSNIFNILVIIGFSSLIRVNRVIPSQIRNEIPFLFLVSALMWGLAADSFIYRWEGGLFLVLFVGFMAFSVIKSRRRFGTDINPDSEEDEMERLKHLGWDLGYLALGLAALMGGAHFALEGSISIARHFGFSERFIGLTIVSAGTGLPELATSSMAALRGKSGIAVGNVIGSNVFNTLMVTGAAASFKTLEIHPRILQLDFLWMLIVTGLLVPAYFVGKRSFNRPTGVVFLSLYIAYVTQLYFSQ